MVTLAKALESRNPFLDAPGVRASVKGRLDLDPQTRINTGIASTWQRCGSRKRVRRNPLLDAHGHARQGFAGVLIGLEGDQALHDVRFDLPFTCHIARNPA
jgi:hypothetical protein